VTSDYYAVLGVTPAAESVVISAAYRALIRHYHPDTNPDPEAQVKVREITVAYSVLRDARKRADYDAQRRGEGDPWSDEQRGEPMDRPRAPAMRGIGIAAAVLALGLVAAVWTWSQPDRSARLATPGQSPVEPARSAPIRAEPIVDLQPESERLARLHEEAEILNQRQAIAPAAELPIPGDPVLVSPAHSVPVPPSPKTPRRSATK